ncbi:hypothetical protein OAA09_00035 [bacterium]|nr:hypothetical protein [bacterium]
MSDKMSSYDLWNSWRDFNQTGKDQSEGTSSVLTEDASGTSSRPLSEKDSAIVAETGQLAQATRQRLRKLDYKDRGPAGSDINPVDLPDTEKELVQLYNHLISMGVSKQEAEEMVNNVLSMLPEGVQSRVDAARLLESCGCGGGEKTADSIPDMGRMLDYGNVQSDANEGQYARDQLTMINYLSGMLSNLVHDEDDLPEWVQTYITQAEMLIGQTFKYMSPHIEREETESAQNDVNHDMSPHNVMVVQQEAALSPMKSRAGASVKKAVEDSRKSGGYASIKLSDIFED